MKLLKLTEKSNWNRGLAATFLTAALTLTLIMQSSAQAPEVSARIAALHKSAIVIDTHIDTPLRLLDEDFNMAERDSLGHIDIPRMEEGGLDAAFFSIWVDMNEYEGPPATHRALKLIDKVYEQARLYPDKIAVVTSVRGIRMAQREGKIALLMGMEGANPLNDDLGLLRLFYRLGVRYLTLTHSKTSNWADSATDDPRHNGLTDFGKDVVREMNRLGMIVDVSHVSAKALADTLAVTTAPVIASHSSVHVLTGIPRNLTDDQLKAIAKNGGVVQIAMGSWFVVPEYDPYTNTDEMKAWRKTRSDAAKEKCGDDARCLSLEGLKRNIEYQKVVPRGTLALIADHVEHVAKVAGADHVGIGSDFDGVPAMPEGFDDVTFLPALTQELASRGFSDADLTKFLGGNTLRVMRAVERAAEPTGRAARRQRQSAQRQQRQPRQPRTQNPYQRNEQFAIGNLRILNTCLARALHRAGGKLPQNADDLTAVGGRCASPRIAAMMSPGGTTENGYTFRYHRVDDQTWTFAATPETFGETGKRSFFTDSSGVIRVTEEDRPATGDDPPIR